jgi:hypothetical protein
LFTARGAAKTVSLAPQTHGHGRQLVEAVSAGRLRDAIAGLPAGAGRIVAHAAREGFLSGLNEVLLLGGGLALLGAIVAALLVREREIERSPLEGQVSSVGATA